MGKDDDNHSQVFGGRDARKVQLETGISAEVKTQWCRDAGESNSVSNVGSAGGAETGVQNPNALADTERGALIVVIGPDGKVCLASRAQKTARRKLCVVQICLWTGI